MDMKYHIADSDGNLTMVVPPNRWEWIQYPKADLVSQRGGCKVGWMTYSTEESAKACSYAAVVNAYLREQKGFDFGYQYPSTIKKVDEGWEVTIP